MSAEQSLWRAVLLQAVQDAMSGVESARAKGDKIAATQAARDYITTPSTGMNMVCILADLEPNAVREAMAKRIAAAPAPQDLFNGSRRRDKSNLQTLTHKGETLSLPEWSDRTGVPLPTIKQRVKKRCIAERILTPHSPAAPKPVKRNGTQARAKTLTFNGKTKTVKEWSLITGVSVFTLNFRIRAGWCPERILNTPARPRGTKAPGIQAGAPGVGEDFAGAQGTGGGTAAQDSYNITFTTLEAAE